mmetsp:Transcript_22004/g.53874  ORF Transcript_22004/g.53874 Transcript_22004/m.53874 type:complete len:529 (-) Transcript_22004:171-1757(-)
MSHIISSVARKTCVSGQIVRRSSSSTNIANLVSQKRAPPNSTKTYWRGYNSLLARATEKEPLRASEKEPLFNPTEQNRLTRQKLVIRSEPAVSNLFDLHKNDPHNCTQRNPRDLCVVEFLEGTSKPMLVEDKLKQRSVFKATDFEPEKTPRDSSAPPFGFFACEEKAAVPYLNAKKEGVIRGEGTRKEVLTYMLDHNSFAGVPKTELVTAKLSNARNSLGFEGLDKVNVEGSLQGFQSNIGTADDFSSSLFDIDSVHRIGCLDVRIMNLDRHLANLLVVSDKASDSGNMAKRNLRLVPVDHCYTLPDFRNLSDVNLEWLHWKQATVPFSKATKKYIESLDIWADASKIMELGLSHGSAISYILGCELLQRGAAAGLTLYDIGNMVQRPFMGEVPSVMEQIVWSALQRWNETEGSEENVSLLDTETRVCQLFSSERKINFNNWVPRKSETALVDSHERLCFKSICGSTGVVFVPTLELLRFIDIACSLIDTEVSQRATVGTNEADNPKKARGNENEGVRSFCVGTQNVH